MRRAARTDDNQAIIVSAFRSLGCSVLDLSRVGQGCGDLLIGSGGLSILCEVKDGSKPPSARKLTPAQKEFRETWKGGLRIVENLQDVEITVRLLRGWHSAICKYGATK